MAKLWIESPPLVASSRLSIHTSNVNRTMFAHLRSDRHTYTAKSYQYTTELIGYCLAYVIVAGTISLISSNNERSPPQEEEEK